MDAAKAQVMEAVRAHFRPEFLNRLDLVICTSNLGDTRSLGIPVAHSIYFEMGSERRASMGIDDSLVRFSVGIEETDDLLADFEQALA